MSRRADRHAAALAALGAAIGDHLTIPSTLTVGHDVRHTVVHLPQPPRPMPTRVIPVVYSADGGQRRQLYPQPIYGKAVALQDVEVAWITGRRDDAELGAFRMELLFEFDGP